MPAYGRPGRTAGSSKFCDRRYHNRDDLMTLICMRDNEFLCTHPSSRFGRAGFESTTFRTPFMPTNTPGDGTYALSWRAPFQARRCTMFPGQNGHLCYTKPPCKKGLVAAGGASEIWPHLHRKL